MGGKHGQRGGGEGSRDQRRDWHILGVGLGAGRGRGRTGGVCGGARGHQPWSRGWGSGMAGRGAGCSAREGAPNAVRLLSTDDRHHGRCVRPMLPPGEPQGPPWAHPQPGVTAASRRQGAPPTARRTNGFLSKQGALRLTKVGMGVVVAPGAARSAREVPSGVDGVGRGGCSCKTHGFACPSAHACVRKMR